MTREEAIQILSTRDAHGVLCGYTSGVTEALDMAIEALQKDTVKIPLPKYVTLGEDSTVEPIGRPHGEWLQREIIDDDMECGVNDDATECSVCGCVFNSHYWAKTYFNYCPNCGARMTPYKGGDEYEKCVEQMEHDIMYEPTYNQDDGSM